MFITEVTVADGGVLVGILLTGVPNIWSIHEQTKY